MKQLNYLYTLSLLERASGKFWFSYSIKVCEWMCKYTATSKTNWKANIFYILQNIYFHK